ncbi:MAG: hypothetical protein WDN09_03590 [bacterium]
MLNILDKRARQFHHHHGVQKLFRRYQRFDRSLEREVNEASGAGHTTRIIVAQETGNVDPDYVTFYGMTKNQYLAK